MVNLIDQRMNIVSHLEELRRRLIWILGTLGVSFLIGWHYCTPIRHYIQKPIGHIPLVYLKLTDAFSAQLRVAFAVSVFLSIPVILYHVLQFCAPVISKNTHRNIWIATAAGSVLFLMGGAFGFFVIAPNLIKMLLSFADASLTPQITIDSYLSVIFSICLIFALIFELPLLMVILAKLKIISHKYLSENRKYFILLNAIIAGILTPPDVISQMFMLVPLLVLFEIGTAAVYFVRK